MSFSCAAVFLAAVLADVLLVSRCVVTGACFSVAVLVVGAWPPTAECVVVFVVAAFGCRVLFSILFCVVFGVAEEFTVASRETEPTGGSGLRITGVAGAAKERDEKEKYKAIAMRLACFLRK